MKRATLNVLGFVFFLFALGCVIEHLAGCKAACTVIDLADQVCPLVVQYTDKAGTKRTVVVSNEDARGLAAVHAAHADAGDP